LLFKRGFVFSREPQSGEGQQTGQQAVVFDGGSAPRNRQKTDEPMPVLPVLFVATPVMALGGLMIVWRETRRTIRRRTDFLLNHDRRR
jgi:hypothetical protein